MDKRRSIATYNELVRIVFFNYYVALLFMDAMTDLILTILLMSLVCCGAHVVINDDIFEGDEKLPDSKLLYAIFYLHLHKPLFKCARCMASLWGGATYYLLHGFDLNIIPAIIATAFLNSVFINYYYSKA